MYSFLITNISLNGKKKAISRMIEEIDELKYSYIYSMDVDENYSVDAEPPKYKNHKLWQLSKLYMDFRNDNIWLYLERNCSEVMKRLENKEADHEDLMIVINVFPGMQKSGFQFNEKAVLDNYYNNIQWAEEIAMITCLEETWRDAYNQFMEKHQEEIQNEFFERLLYDIFKAEYYENDQKRVGRILDMANIWCEQLGITYTEEDEILLYEEAGYEPPEKQKKNKKIEISEEEKKQEIEEKNYEEINAEAKKWFDPEDTYLTPKQIKEMERKRGCDYRKGYLTRGKFTEQNFSVVLEFLEYTACIPKKEYSFYKELTSYLLKEENEVKEQLGKLALKLIFSGNERFTKEEAEKYLGVKDISGFIDVCINRNVIYKNGKWYCYWNQAYMYTLALETWCSKKREMDDYTDMLEKCGAGDILDNWVTFFYDNEKTIFVKNVALPIFDKFLQEIHRMNQKEQSVWLLEQLDFGAHFVRGKDEVGIIMLYKVESAMSIFEIIEENVFLHLYDSVYDLFESNYKKLTPYIEKDNGIVKLKTLLHETKWKKRLETVGGYEAAEQVLEQMQSMIQCYGN